MFVTPDHAIRVLEILEKADFATGVEDPIWLSKAFKYVVLVDVIFRSIGDIYVDDEMLERAGGNSPYHWYDALAIIARQEVDWGYVVRRARSAGHRRVLSLLIYAESTDLAVPVTAIGDLFAQLYPTTSWN